jgi:hypothetical protein
MYGTRILPFADTDSDTLRHVRRILVVAPVLLLVLFGWGFQHGQSDLNNFSDPYTLQMKHGDDLRRIILRTFDKGILVRDAVEKRIEFVRWDDVIKVSRYSDLRPEVPLSCLWIRVKCPEGPEPP